MLKELFAAEVVIIRVLHPALAQRLVGEVVHVLDDGEPRHQSCREWRMTWLLGVDLAEPSLQKAPVDRLRQLQQRVLHVDDLIEPRAEQILFTRLPSLLWPHRSPSASTSIKAENHGFRFERTPPPNLQENRPVSRTTLQIRLIQLSKSRFPLNDLDVLHGRLWRGPLTPTLSPHAGRGSRRAVPYVKAQPSRGISGASLSILHLAIAEQD